MKQNTFAFTLFAVLLLLFFFFSGGPSDVFYVPNWKTKNFCDSL